MIVHDADAELAARRATVAAMAAICPFCGRSLAGHGGTYAKPEVAKDERPMTNDDAPSGWRDKPAML